MPFTAAAGLTCFALLALPSGAAAQTDSPINPDLAGAGAPVPAVLLNRILESYKTSSGHSVNFTVNGAGGGMRLLAQKQSDFAAIDLPPSAIDAKEFPKDVEVIPFVGEAIAVCCNLPGVHTPPRLTGDVLTDIYLGTITRWDDPRIASLNPSTHLPSLKISPVSKRGWAQNYWFSGYLSRESTIWASKVGTGRIIHWPTGVIAPRDDVAYMVVYNNPGAIGYFEATHIRPELRDLTLCKLMNVSGNFVRPDALNATQALEAMVAQTNRDVGASVLNAPGKRSYPIVGYDYLLIPHHSVSAAREREILQMALFVNRHARKAAIDLGYVPLPEAIVRRNERMILRMLQQHSSGAEPSTAPRGSR